MYKLLIIIIFILLIITYCESKNCKYNKEYNICKIAKSSPNLDNKHIYNNNTNINKIIDSNTLSELLDCQLKDQFPTCNQNYCTSYVSGYQCHYKNKPYYIKLPLCPVELCQCYGQFDCYYDNPDQELCGCVMGNNIITIGFV